MELKKRLNFGSMMRKRSSKSQRGTRVRAATDRAPKPKMYRSIRMQTRPSPMPREEWWVQHVTATRAHS
jgi:hypothetical protein